MPSDQQNQSPSQHKRRVTDSYPQVDGLSASDHQLLSAITAQLTTISATQTAQLRKLSNIEARLDTYETAFVLNDLNRPDFEGHRASHRSMIEAAKALETYKVDVTKKVLAWVGGIIALVFFTGAGEVIRKFLTQIPIP